MTTNTEVRQLWVADVFAITSYTTEEFDELCFEFGEQEQTRLRGGLC